MCAHTHMRTRVCMRTCMFPHPLQSPGTSHHSQTLLGNGGSQTERHLNQGKDVCQSIGCWATQPVSDPANQNGAWTSIFLPSPREMLMPRAHRSYWKSAADAGSDCLNRSQYALIITYTLENQTWICWSVPLLFPFVRRSWLSNSARGMGAPIRNPHFFIYNQSLN